MPRSSGGKGKSSRPPRKIRKRLYERDKGCTFPGCNEKNFDNLERHHWNHCGRLSYTLGDIIIDPADESVQSLLCGSNGHHKIVHKALKIIFVLFKKKDEIHEEEIIEQIKKKMGKDGVSPRKLYEVIIECQKGLFELKSGILTRTNLGVFITKTKYAGV